jgi:hypothetical protein
VYTLLSIDEQAMQMRSLICAAAIVLAFALPSNGEEAKSSPINFARDVRPILARHCFACHGPDESQRKAKLRLDTRDGAFSQREDSTPFKPKDLANSEASARIVSNEVEYQMPPGGPAKRLSADEITVIRRWIEEGAQWQSHWSFEKPLKASLPMVADKTWAKNPIDVFVQRQLEVAGLSHSYEADKPTLARRVSLDLTGLPPDPKALASFLTDQSPAAYEKYVDQLLASPAYGERWARVWLDLARFADTKGYEKDLKRNIWRYRDWVIQAINDDLPYRAFTRDQLAGDLVGNPKPEQLLATAFHRNTLSNDEGGTDDEEFRIAAVKDRVDTTIQVWMGLTMGCAKCHSHKYDPISHREYYQLYSYFNQTADNDRSDDSPTELLPDVVQQKRIDELKIQLQKKQSELEAWTPERLTALAAWERSIREKSVWKLIVASKVEVASGSTTKKLDDGSILVSKGTPANEKYQVLFSPDARLITAVRLEVIPDASHPKKGVGRSRDDGNFVLSKISLQQRTKAGKVTEISFGSAEADFSQDKYPVSDAITNSDLKKSGWAVSPKQSEQHQAVFRLKNPLKVSDGDEVAITLQHEFEFAYPGFSIGRFRISTTDSTEPKMSAFIPNAIQQVLDTSIEKRTASQKSDLLKFFVQQSSDTAKDRAELDRLRKTLKSLEDSVRTPILRELPKDKQRVTRIQKRGNFLDPGDPVNPATPAAFGTLPKGSPNNRLGLVDWLFSEENPLTARVAVNRQWAQFFGMGLVETQEDFGSQGKPASHPELLDWLAVDFRENGWSLKRLNKMIVMSATYRQSSKVTPELLARDPQNRWLARGSRSRLDAETIRDETLEVSGLLSHKLKGPSVMPYQPDGIWKSTYNTDSWKTSDGEDRHRRSIYTFMKRTSPYPAMLTFDAPSRELCTVRRINSNTPLQALVTLNDRVYVEAAQSLARMMVKEAGKSPEARIAFALQRVLSREPKASEIAVLVNLYQKRLAYYQGEQAAAIRMATEPIGPLPKGSDPAELAALTSVCNVIFNLDEFLNRN